MRYFFFLTLFISSFAYSAETLTYYYAKGVVNSVLKTTGHTISNIAACKEMATLAGKAYSHSDSNILTGNCYAKALNGDLWNVGTYHKVVEECEYGIEGSYCIVEPSCPDGQTWDANIGFCVNNDPCEELSGTSTGFSTSGNSSDPNAFYNPIGGGDGGGGGSSSGGGSWVHPESIVANGCSAIVSPGTRCKVYGNGDYVCTGNAIYTGQTAGTDDGSVPSDECTTDCPPIDSTGSSEESQDCTDWVYDAEGRRTKTCETSTKADQPGTSDCLTNGSLVCVKPSPVPETQTTTKQDTVKETTNSDGGKTTETTTTTTKTYCSEGACNTTNTTNKTTVVTNGSGEPVSTVGTCEGADCDEPQEEEGVPDMLDLVQPTATGSFDPEDWDEKIEEAKQALSDATGGLTDSFSQYTSLGISSSSGALPCTQTPPILGRTYSFCLSEFQDELLVIGNAIFLIACLFAAFIVFRP